MILATLPFAVVAAPTPAAVARAKVFGMCQMPESPADIQNLADMGVDIVVRGISCAWDADPAQARARMAAQAGLARLARKDGITFCTMVTSSAIFPDIVPPGKLDAWASRDAHGHVIKTASWHQGCLNNPEYRDFVRDIGRAVIDGGADGIHYDESYSRWFWMSPIPGFCDYCCAEMRSWLKSHFDAATLRRRWGIEDIDTFNYRQYLADHGYADEPWRSPLNDQWWLMEIHSTLHWEKWIVDDNKAYAREKYGKDLVVNANQYMIPDLSAVLTGESRIYDFVNMGTGLAINYRGAGGVDRTLTVSPSQGSLVPVYQMGRAHAPNKPVVVFLDIQEHPGNLAGLPPRQEGLYMQWLFAEAHLSGCFFAGHYRFSNYEAPLKPQIAAGQFMKHHSAWYKHSQPLAKIAVLFSYPSQIWDMYADYWSKALRFPSHSRQYYALCQALMRANLQWKTVFVPDGDVFPGHLTAADLKGYDVLIAPGMYAANDAELEALREYLRGGGELLVTGPFAEYNGLHERRSGNALAGLEAAGKVDVLPDNFEPDMAGTETGAEARLVEALVGKLGYQPQALVANPDARLEVHLRRPAAGRERLVDLVNTDFNWQRGFRAAPATAVSVRLGNGFHARSARLYTMDRPAGEPVPVSVAGAVTTLQVPEVESYAIVVLEP